MTEEARKAGTHRLLLADEAATLRLAADIAAILKPGDIVALSGHLGSGKSLLARAILRELARDPTLEAPSPTFTLVQPYDTVPPVWHVDLYRLDTPDEAAALGLDEAYDDQVTLIEWPERLGTQGWPDALTLRISGAGDARVLTAEVPAAWEARWPLR